MSCGARGTCVEDHGGGERVRKACLACGLRSLMYSPWSPGDIYRAVVGKEIKGPPMARPELSVSPENIFKMLPALARGKQGWKETLRLPSRQDRRLSHMHAHTRTHTNAYAYHTGRHMHLGHLFFSWKVLADLTRGNFEAQS